MLLRFAGRLVQLAVVFVERVMVLLVRFFDALRAFVLYLFPWMLGFSFVGYLVCLVGWYAAMLNGAPEETQDVWAKLSFLLLSGWAVPMLMMWLSRRKG